MNRMDVPFVWGWYQINLCVILAHDDNFWLYLSIYQVINIFDYVFCNFRSWVLIFLDWNFDFVCRYPRDMNFRIKSFFELSLLAFLYDVFPCVDLDWFYCCTRPISYYFCGTELYARFTLKHCQQFMSIYVIRLAWYLKVLWFSDIETSGLGKMGMGRTSSIMT